MRLLLLALLLHAPPTLYHVPYRLAPTNHIIVRARINGHGPYNLILDTGAPALFIPGALAKEAGVHPDAAHWGAVDRVEIEGGAVVAPVRARVEDAFQLQTINSLALAGVRVDGLIGYSVLARFRIALDLTRQEMTWTALDYTPPPPAVMTAKDRARVTKQMQDMKQLEGLAKMARAMFSKKAGEVAPRGFIGIELESVVGEPRIAAALPGSPAAQAGLRAGDVVTSVQRKGAQPAASVKTGRALLAALASVAPDEAVLFHVRRDGVDVAASVHAAKGGL